MEPGISTSQAITLATNDQLYKAGGFQPLVLAYVNGSPVRLGDVAQAVDGVANAQLVTVSPAAHLANVEQPLEVTGALLGHLDAAGDER